MLEEEYEKSRRKLPRHLRPSAEPERPFSYRIRPVEDRDIPDIREIYNYYVTNSVVTFDEKRWTIAQWREKVAHLRKLKMPFLVAEAPTGQILADRAKAVTVVPFKGPNYFAVRQAISDAINRVDVDKTDDAAASWEKAVKEVAALG